MPKVDYTRWMEDNFSYIEDLKFKQIIIAGSHDSGTYKIDAKLFNSFYVTQSVDITGQLASGSRYFDLRFKNTSDAVRIFHGPGTGPTLYEIGQQFIDFLKNTKRELVVLRIKLKNADAFDTVMTYFKNNFYDHNLLVTQKRIYDKSDINHKAMMSKLGEYTKPIMDIKYKDFFDSEHSKALLLFYHDKDDVTHNKPCSAYYNHIANMHNGIPKFEFLFCYKSLYSGKYSNAHYMTTAFKGQEENLKKWKEKNIDWLKSKGQLDTLFGLHLTITYGDVVGNTERKAAKMTHVDKNYNIFCMACKLGFMGHLFIVDAIGNDAWYSKNYYDYDRFNLGKPYSLMEDKSKYHSLVMNLIINLNKAYLELFATQERSLTYNWIEIVKKRFDCINSKFVCPLIANEQQSL